MTITALKIQCIAMQNWHEMVGIKGRVVLYQALVALLDQVAEEALGSRPEWKLISANGVPLFVPTTSGHLIVHLPGGGYDNGLEVPWFIAGLMVTIFALEYAAFSSSGSARKGLDADLLALKYQALNTLRSWCESPAGESLSASILGLIE